MALKIVFPWARLEPGQGFFIPCLDAEQVIALGLRDALLCDVRGKATAGVRGGLIGVWFSRTI